MRLFWTVTLVSCALLPVPVLAQDWRGGSGRLEGKILDADGKPIDGASAKLDLPGRGGTEVKADKKGHWAILGLADGSWNVDIQAPGFVTKRISVPLSGDQRPPLIEIKLEKAAPKGPPPELVQALKDGDQALQDGKYAEARANYEKLLAARPDLGKALQMQIARCYKMEGNVPAELDHLQAASDLSPGDPVIHTLMAMEAVKAGLMDRAAELMKTVDESTIKDPEVFYNIGVSFLNNNHQEDAITWFTKAVTLDPNYVDGYFQRGLTYLGLLKTAECRADLEKVLALQPAGPQADLAKKALASLK